MQADQECKFVIGLKTSTMMDEPTDHTGRFDSFFPPVQNPFLKNLLALGGKFHTNFACFGNTSYLVPCPYFQTIVV